MSLGKTFSDTPAVHMQPDRIVYGHTTDAADLDDLIRSLAVDIGLAGAS